MQCVECSPTSRGPLDNLWMIWEEERGMELACLSGFSNTCYFNFSSESLEKATRNSFNPRLFLQNTFHQYQLEKELFGVIILTLRFFSISEKISSRSIKYILVRADFNARGIPLSPVFATLNVQRLAVYLPRRTKMVLNLLTFLFIKKNIG